MSLPTAYFDELYAHRSDPWRYLTRWYERRKRSITLASLPRERYTTALEVGCSIGVLTAELAARCDDLLAVDVSQRAVELARERVGTAARIEKIEFAAPLPSGPFDLIVVSEVGYYLDRAGWDDMLRQATGALSPGGDLVLCHWRHPVADYPQSGDEVHAHAETAGLVRLLRHEEEDFMLDVLSADGRSVARREGFL
jgi:SAM-dependent methyltransferase